VPDSRTIRITPAGRRGFTDLLGGAPDWLNTAAR
jgi:hypothetical protein